MVHFGILSKVYKKKNSKSSKYAHGFILLNFFSDYFIMFGLC